MSALFLLTVMDSDDQGSAAPGAVLLLIIGEPFSEEHKDATLAEVTRGKKTCLPKIIGRDGVIVDSFNA